jgi:hypothetical protein
MKIEKFPKNVRYVGAGKITEKLYEHEDAASEHIQKAAEEYAKIVEAAHDRSVDLWKEAVPQVLGSFAERFGYVLAREVEES